VDAQIINDKNCIFCRIAQGKIPSIKVAENDVALAFMDINPVAPGHCLVIPKHHAENIFVTPEHALTAAINMVSRVASAIHRAIEPQGINILQANGPGAKQSVFHTHFHIIPRMVDDDLRMNWDQKLGVVADIEEVAKRIHATLERVN